MDSHSDTRAELDDRKHCILMKSSSEQGVASRSGVAMVVCKETATSTYPQIMVIDGFGGLFGLEFGLYPKEKLGNSGCKVVASNTDAKLLQQVLSNMWLQDCQLFLPPLHRTESYVSFEY